MKVDERLTGLQKVGTHPPPFEPLPVFSEGVEVSAGASASTPVVATGIGLLASSVVNAWKLVGSTLKVVCPTAGINVTEALLEIELDVEELTSDEELDKVVGMGVVGEVVGEGEGLWLV